MSDQELPEPSTVAGDRGRRTPTTQIIGRIVVVLLIVVFVVFAAANSQYVSFSWVLGETRAQFDATGGHESGGVRLIVLLVGSLAVGILIGALLSWQGARSRRRSTRSEP